MINEANEPSSACRLWRIHQVETSTRPKLAISFSPVFWVRSSGRRHNKKVKPAKTALARCPVPQLEEITRFDQSRVRKPVEAVASGRIHDDEFDGAVVGYAFRGSGPVRTCQVGVDLQTPADRRRRPIDLRCVCGREFDAQYRPAGGLHGVERPEPAGERVIAAGHRPASVVLADGAADG